MKTRTQISLESEQHRRAKARAAELRISLAEYLRRLVERDLGESERAGAPGGIDSVFNLGRSGGSDVARHKDAYVAEAVEAHRTR